MDIIELQPRPNMDVVDVSDGTKLRVVDTVDIAQVDGGVTKVVMLVDLETGKYSVDVVRNLAKAVHMHDDSIVLRYTLTMVDVINDRHVVVRDQDITGIVQHMIEQLRVAYGYASHRVVLSITIDGSEVSVI